MGAGSAWVAWLNGQYLGGETGNGQTFKFNQSLIDTSKENVLSLLMWTTGHEEDWNNNDQYKTPRGYTGVTLVGGNNATISWKVQGKVDFSIYYESNSAVMTFSSHDLIVHFNYIGNLGGEDIVDTVRGTLNEGGLYGERMGWHLPGYPDHSWQQVSVPETKQRPGVSWYRTTFDLNIPKNHDVPLGIRFTDNKSERYRALLFINGWQFGKYGKEKCFIRL
jgi:beta-galactosidase